MTEPTSNKIVLLDVRASYLYVFSPFKGKNDKGDDTASYTGHFIFAQSSPNFALAQAAIRAAAQEKWPGKHMEILKQLSAQDRLCLHKGDVSKPGEEAYAGNLYISSNGKKRPTIIDGDRTPLVEADGRPYSGCYVNAIVDIWAQACSSCVMARRSAAVARRTQRNSRSMRRMRTATRRPMPRLPTT